MRHPHVARLIFNTPLLAEAGAASLLADAFLAHSASGVGSALPPAPERSPAQAFGSHHDSAKSRGKPYAVTAEGIGILAVYGPLVQRVGQLTPECTEFASYERLSRAFDLMLADPEVRAIMLELDSPGGQVSGAFTFAGKILAARARKPVWAHANEQAYSAAYALGSAAQRLVMADTGGVGSIGVIWLHMSTADRDARQGYEYTAFYSGNRKNDFNPHFKLSDDAKTIAQREVDALHAKFAAHVATARRISVDQVNATQSATLSADEAMKGRFVDAVASFDDTIIELTRAVYTGRIHAIGGLPSPTSTTKGVQNMEGVSFTAADLDAARADGRRIERERIAGIFALAEAKDRPKAAAHLAHGTGLSVDEARGLLSTMAIETPRGSAFLDLMAGVPNPQVGASGGGDYSGADRIIIDAAAIFAARQKAVEGAQKLPAGRA